MNLIAALLILFTVSEPTMSKVTPHYEQIAVDFLQDSLYVEDKYRISFNGMTDSTKTVLTNSCLIKYPITDSVLADYLKQESLLIDNMILENDHSKLINVEGITHLKFEDNQKGCIAFHKKRVLNVFQHIVVNGTVYVWIRLNGKRNRFNDYYVMLNSNGEILDFCQSQFSKHKAI